MIRHSFRNNGVTLIEILVALEIVAIMTAIGFSAVSASKGAAKSSACLVTIGQVGSASTLYAADFDERFPIVCYDLGFGKQESSKSTTWRQLIQPYGSDQLRCGAHNPNPTVPPHYQAGYCQNGLTQRLEKDGESLFRVGSLASGEIVSASKFVTHAECRTHLISIINPDYRPLCEYSIAWDLEPTYRRETEGKLRHSGGSNYAFLDGHAKRISADAASNKTNTFKLFSPDAE